MYIETKNYKVKFKNDPIIFIMPGLWINFYYDSGLASQIEYVEEIRSN